VVVVSFNAFYSLGASAEVIARFFSLAALHLSLQLDLPTSVDEAIQNGESRRTLIQRATVPHPHGIGGKSRKIVTSNDATQQSEFAETLERTGISRPAASGSGNTSFLHPL